MSNDTHNPSYKTVEKIKNEGKIVKVVDIDLTIQMLNKYLDSPAINPLLSALEALKAEPQSETLQIQVINSFNALGTLQGAVLTYAPYLNIFVSDDPFDIH